MFVCENKCGIVAWNKWELSDTDLVVLRVFLIIQVIPRHVDLTIELGKNTVDHLNDILYALICISGKTYAASVTTLSYFAFELDFLHGT